MSSEPIHIVIDPHADLRLSLHEEYTAACEVSDSSDDVDAVGAADDTIERLAEQWWAACEKVAIEHGYEPLWAGYDSMQADKWSNRNTVPDEDVNDAWQRVQDEASAVWDK